MRKRTLIIKWQRLVEKGKTCPRCGSTEQELSKAIKELKKRLAPLGITVELIKEKLNLKTFSKRPSESNKIWVNKKSLESWLKADVGKSKCCDVCGPNECRTIAIGNRKYETIPSSLIVKAGLIAVSKKFERNPI